MRLTKLAIIAALSAFTLTVNAASSDDSGDIVSEDHLLSLDVEARLDWQMLRPEDKLDNSQTGFIGKYIALKATGQLTDGLTYTWCQRFSRTPKDNTFWDQTDILALSYKTGNFDFGAGKQVVLIGGYEYDRAPINLMCPNLFVSNVACYQFGVSAGYQLTQHDHLAFQVSQSIFATADERNMYAYNLMWNSGRNLTDRLRYESIWSINEIEYTKGKYCNYIALGNKLLIDDKFTVLLDLMTRTYPDNRAFKNNTFMAEFAWIPSSKWKFTGKASYDCNRGVNLTRNTEIARGTELVIAGAVAEYYPLTTKRNLLKVHAAVFGSWGDNYSSADMMQKNTLYASVGLTWHMNLFNIK